MLLTPQRTLLYHMQAAAAAVAGVGYGNRAAAFRVRQLHPPAGPALLP
jgi:hypothetical protein